MRILTASIGGRHDARIEKTWRGTWEAFIKGILAKVPETEDKSSNGWVSGAEYEEPWRNSANFTARHFLSFDYDRLAPADFESIRGALRQYAYLAYTTFSHRDEHPRCRFWLPLSRHCGYDEFQAVSRRIASLAGIELAARESHTPCQFMYRPTIRKGAKFEHWINKAPWVDVDATLASYSDWTDRSQWPHRAKADEMRSTECVSPLDKPGIVGVFCRSFTVEQAIERFELPYTRIR